MNGRQDVRERLCALCAAAVTLGAALAWHHGAAAVLLEALALAGAALWWHSGD